MTARAERFRRVLLATTLAAALGTACGGGSEAPPAGEKPATPDQNDPDFRVERVRQWMLIGDGLTPGQDQLEIQVFAPGGVDYMHAWIDDLPGVTLVPGDQPGEFRQVIDVADLPAGEHDLLLGADGGDTAVAHLVFRRSYPLYLVVTNDWDDADNSDYSLTLQTELHDRHPELRMTHFVGPYTFTDPTVTPARRQQLVDWVTGMRDQYRDEIGLHLHPYCNFIDTTSVPCRTEPSTVYPNGDTTGYTVEVAAYSEDELFSILQAADQLFEQAGLGKPTSFRAGGWTADLGTLSALARDRFTVDASALNWGRMEEWEGVMNGVLYQWNMEHWASINDTSQPYYPSESDILESTNPTLPVLEVPDNGIMVDYVTAQEMVDIFDENFDGSPLLAPTVYSIGYHPPNFTDGYQRAIGGALAHAEQFLASQDHGPVVYATASELPQVWSAP